MHIYPIKNHCKLYPFFPPFNCLFLNSNFVEFIFACLQLIVLYVDFKIDESYTPSKVSIRAGDGFHNLKVISSIRIVFRVGSTFSFLFLLLLLVLKGGK